MAVRVYGRLCGRQLPFSKAVSLCACIGAMLAQPETLLLPSRNSAPPPERLMDALSIVSLTSCSVYVAAAGWVLFGMATT